MADNKFSIELTSGLTPINNGDFPLMQAKDIQIDESGKRLDEYLEENNNMPTDIDEKLTDIEEAIIALADKIDSGGEINLQTRQVAPSNETQTITADTDKGYDALGTVIVEPIMTAEASVSANGTYTNTQLTGRAEIYPSKVTVNVPVPNIQCSNGILYIY